MFTSMVLVIVIIQIAVTIAMMEESFESLSPSPFRLGWGKSLQLTDARIPATFKIEFIWIFLPMAMNFVSKERW